MNIVLSLLLAVAAGWSQDGSVDSQNLPGMDQPAKRPAPKDEPKGDPKAEEKKDDKKEEPAAKTVNPADGGLPTEVIIKGSDSGSKFDAKKPPLNIETNAFDSIQASLVPDESLLLAESPFTVSWSRTHPEFLSAERVIQPYRTTFSDRGGIVFNMVDQLSAVLQRPIDPKEARSWQWSLTIADEEGRVFQQYEGSKDPPQELVWNGQNDQGEWIKAGRSYSAVYTFTDASGSPRTKVGKPIQFTGIVHQESDGLHISMDSALLFGSTKNGREIEKAGMNLMRSAADLIKRRFTGVPIKVQATASTKELAEAQAQKVQEYLVKELMILAQNTSLDSSHAPFSEQRIDVVLLNR